MTPRPVGPALLGRLAQDAWPAVAPRAAEELLTAITTNARRLLGAAACSIALLSPDESELTYTASAVGGEGEVHGLRLPSDEGVAGWVVQSEQPIEVRDLGRDERFSRAAAERTGYVPDAILAVPIRTPRRLLGVLSVLDRDVNRPGAVHDLQLLGMVADVAALALETVAAFDDLGRVLLNGLAQATDAADAGRALRAAARNLGPADQDAARVAGLLSDLGRPGSPERRLALSVVEDLLAYTRERRSPAP
ncbi:MAG: GAF domain-containing protein [Candidatus Dormiibacterota bacterium]